MSLVPRKFITNKTFENAESKLNKIEIFVHGANISVKGILKENFSIATEANYDNIFSVSDSLNSLRKVADFGFGASFLNTGQWTRKYYKGGSYMKISPKFRVVDYEGNNDPLLAAFLLINASLPTPGKDDHFLDELKSMTYDDFTSKFSIELPSVDPRAAAINPLGVVGKIGQSAWHSLKEMVSGQIGNSPNPVSVKACNFFYWEEMVIDSVNVEFSKEMTAYGPLYVDIDCNMSSREVATKGRTGLETFDSRVEIINASSDSGANGGRGVA